VIAKVLLFFVAAVMNLGLYLAVPLFQSWLQRHALKAEKSVDRVEREITYSTPEPDKVVKREIKEIKLTTVRPPSPRQSRPSLPGGGLKLDLSTAGGSMGLVSGGDRTGPLGSGTGGGKGSGQGAMIFESGQTDSDARIIGPDAAPKYPIRADREDVTGFVDLVFVVNESGFPDQFSVLKEDPEGYGFAAAAIEAWRKLRFEPALLQKTPVKQKVRRRIQFNK